MSEKNTMTRNAMLFLPAKLAEGVLLMAMSSLYSHILTKSAVGLFNATNMMVNFTFLLIAAWMSNSNTRYVAEEFKKDRAARLFSTIVPIYVLLCAVVGVICAGLFCYTRQTYYLLGAVMFCTYSAFTILNNTMVQLSIIRPAIILSLTSASLKLLLAILFVGGKSGFGSPTPALLANILADGIGAIGAVISLGMPHVVRLRRFSQAMLKKLLAFGVPLMGVALCTALLNLIDRFLVLGIYGDEVFAVYSSNVSIPSSIFNMLSVGVLRGVYPAVLRAWRESGRTEARGLLNAGVRLYMLVAFPAAFGLTAVALPFTRVFFAAGYDAGAPAIGLMSFTMVFMGLTGHPQQRHRHPHQNRIQRRAHPGHGLSWRCSRLSYRALLVFSYHLSARAPLLYVACFHGLVPAHPGLRRAVRRGGLRLHAAPPEQPAPPAHRHPGRWADLPRLCRCLGRGARGGIPISQEAGPFLRLCLEIQPVK